MLIFSHGSLFALQLRFDSLPSPSKGSLGAIMAIKQDSVGFIWIGTQEGLFRFDGYEYLHFLSNPYQSSSLSYDVVSDLEVDQDGRLWIATDGGGLNLYQPNTQSFKQFNSRSHPDLILNNRIRSLYKDSQNNFWLGFDDGRLVQFNPRNPNITLKTFSKNTDYPNFGESAIRDIVEDHSGDLWIAHQNDGLSKITLLTNQIERYSSNSRQHLISLPSDRLLSLTVDGFNRLWIGSNGGGLTQVDLNTFEQSNFIANNESLETISNNIIRDLFEDDKNRLWISTDQGLCRTQLSHTFSKILNFNCESHTISDPWSLIDNRVTTVTVDKGGIIWVGTYNGISKWNELKANFQHFRKSSQSFDSLTSNVITGFSEGPDGKVWIATSNGVSIFDPKAQKISQLQSHPDHQGPSDSRVMSILADSNGSIWLGTRSKGLDRYDPKTKKFVNFRHEPDNPSSLLGNGVTAIYEDSKNNLWVATYMGGVSRLNPDGKSFTNLTHSPDNENSLSTNRIIGIFEDSRGVIWFASEQGINRYDPSSNQIKRILHDPDNINSLSGNMVFSINEDNDGFLWFGTQSRGLNKLIGDDSLGRPIFQHINQSNGLLSNTIYSIQKDKYGNLWLSSNAGLARLNPTSLEIKHFDQSHGLQDNEFNFGASLAASDKSLYFGGNKGFNRFQPDIQINPNSPNVLITRILVNNKPLEGELDVSNLRDLTLDYKHNFVTFEFAALDYSAPENNQYRYRLVGINDDWIEAKNLRRANYTNLPDGTYEFIVLGSNNDGIWSGNSSQLTLTITAAPWKTKTAYLIYILIILSILYSFFRLQRKEIKRKAEYAKRLKVQVDERTHELDEKSKELEKRNLELETANQQLEELSVTDSLTGLKNRAYYSQFIPTEFSAIKRKIREDKNIETKLAVILLDMDGLKAINDTYGHTCGDNAIKQFATILKSQCRAADTVIRLAGDEFVIVSRVNSEKDVIQCIERILSSASDHDFDLGGGLTYKTSCSVGFSIYPLNSNLDSISSEEATVLADHAMYCAKRHGKGAWVGVTKSVESFSFKDIKHELKSNSIMDFSDRLTIESSLSSEAFKESS